MKNCPAPVWLSYGRSYGDFDPLVCPCDADALAPAGVQAVPSPRVVRLVAGRRNLYQQSRRSRRAQHEQAVALRSRRRVQLDDVHAAHERRRDRERERRVPAALGQARREAMRARRLASQRQRAALQHQPAAKPPIPAHAVDLHRHRACARRAHVHALGLARRDRLLRHVPRDRAVGRSPDLIRRSLQAPRRRPRRAILRRDRRRRARRSHEPAVGRAFDGMLRYVRRVCALCRAPVGSRCARL